MQTSITTATRIQLKTLNRRLKIAKRGHKMLKDKYEEMIKIFTSTLKKAVKLRREVDRDFVPLLNAFLTYRAGVSNSEISRNFDNTHEIKFSFDKKNLFNLDVPSVKLLDLDTQDQNSYNLLLPNFLVQKVRNFMPVLCKLAELTREVKLISQDIEKTKRRVNALSENLIPSLERDIKYISLKLEENDRASQVRLLKYKQGK